MFPAEGGYDLKEFEDYDEDRLLTLVAARPLRRLRPQGAPCSTPHGSTPTRASVRSHGDKDRGEGEHTFDQRSEEGSGEGAGVLAPRHRIPRFRAPFPARRPCRGEGR